MAAKKKPAGKKSLVIVESPAKAKTINKYLGRGFLVRASMGHVRDLPKSRLGVDPESGFEPKYLVLRDRKEVIDDLKKAFKECDSVYLAPDPDREGEAIAWHLKETLKVPDDKAFRVTFNEITERAVKEAFESPTSIDSNKVNAQQARRILDRIVGYKLSPLLWEKVAKNLSAGRVQSVTVLLLVEREREIRAFKSEEFWKIAQDLDSPGGIFTVHLKKRDGKLFEPVNRAEAEEVVAHFKAASWRVLEAMRRRKTERAPPPFKTSTLQQAASNTLRFSASRTMRVAQQLYEGMELGDEGSVGLITYMRTDSFNLSADAIQQVREFIPANFGADYLPEMPNFFRAGKRAQEAHEAVRPTSAARTPDSIKKYLQKDQLRLYTLIWERFVACQMTPAVFDITDVTVEAGPGNASADGRQRAPSYELRCQGRIGVFDGYQKVLGARGDDVELPPLEASTPISPAGPAKAEQEFTKPPPRYSEATLVKALEKQGIGRPSTYASIISTVQQRGYVFQEERKFHATELGEITTDLLKPYFPEILDVAFTAAMEGKLDTIEEGGANWVDVLREFYEPFAKDLEKAKEEMRSLRAEPKKAERACPTCGKEMVYRWRGASKYIACVDYPECKTTISLDRYGKEKLRELTDHACPKCAKQMILRSGRFGKFLACSGYPECKSTLSVDKEGKPIFPEKADVKCPECGSDMIVRRGRRGRFIACTGYPKCKKTLPYKPGEETKESEDPVESRAAE
ncbi:MAG: type I DNA topoisomerase [Planctomycetaceae bacterium]